MEGRSYRNVTKTVKQNLTYHEVSTYEHRFPIRPVIRVCLFIVREYLGLPPIFTYSYLRQAYRAISFSETLSYEHYSFHGITLKGVVAITVGTLRSAVRFLLAGDIPLFTGALSSHSSPVIVVFYIPPFFAVLITFSSLLLRRCLLIRFCTSLLFLRSTKNFWC